MVTPCHHLGDRDCDCAGSLQDILSSADQELEVNTPETLPLLGEGETHLLRLALERIDESFNQPQELHASLGFSPKGAAHDG